MDPVTGGVAQTLRNLLPVLMRMGVTSEVVCFDAPLTSSGQINDGFVIHRIGPSVGRWGRVKGFKHWLDSYAYKYDVIVLHGLWLYNGYAYTKWIRGRSGRYGKRSIRTWVMPHGMLDPWFQRSSGRCLKSIRNLIYWLLIESRTISLADLLIFTSEAERDKARFSFPFYQPKRTTIISLGLPEPTLDKPACNSSRDKPKHPEDAFLLALGRIDPKKGFHLLPEVWMRLMQDPNYSKNLPILFMAGPGWESDHGTFLMDRIKALGLGHLILTNGMLQGDAKWAALRSCEALIMPSHQENFGLVAAEALACGTPVLLTEQVDISAEIVMAGAGLSGSDTVEGIERMVKQWIDLNHGTRQHMKAAARKAYIERFDIHHTASRFIHLFEE